jgi:hypothetical protein
MSSKSFKFAPVPAVLGLLVASLIALAINHWSSFPFWIVFLIVVGGMFINGIVAQFEDDAPGGFNDPNPPPRPDDNK